MCIGSAPVYGSVTVEAVKEAMKSEGAPCQPLFLPVSSNPNSYFSTCEEDDGVKLPDEEHKPRLLHYVVATSEDVKEVVSRLEVCPAVVHERAPLWRAGRG